MDSNRSSSVHLPALDGLRGMAILLVIACHLSEHFNFSSQPLQAIDTIAFAGWTGVDLFFVLSGFLITGILWDSRGKRGYFRNFYARRTLRIFPLYYVALVVFFVLVPAISGDEGMADTIRARHYWGWFATYLVDVLIANKGFLFAGHFWTLSVEEHFYLLWPVLVYKLGRRTLIGVCITMIAGALALRAWMLVSGAYPEAIYVLTPCRMDGLALGALVALILRGPSGLDALIRPARIVLPISAMLWIVMMYVYGEWNQYGVKPGENQAMTQIAGYSITEAFYASLLIFALASRGVRAAMSAGVLRFFGKISYSLYIFHVPIIAFLGDRYVPGYPDRSIIVWLIDVLPAGSFTQNILAPGLDALVFIALAVGSSVAAALTTWYLIESPCLRLKRFFPYQENVAVKEIASSAANA